jgi:hypothetical protein
MCGRVTLVRLWQIMRPTVTRRTPIIESVSASNHTTSRSLYVILQETFQIYSANFSIEDKTLPSSTPSHKQYPSHHRSRDLNTIPFSRTAHIFQNSRSHKHLVSQYENWAAIATWHRRFVHPCPSHIEHSTRMRSSGLHSGKISPLVNFRLICLRKTDQIEKAVLLARHRN